MATFYIDETRGGGGGGGSGGSSDSGLRSLAQLAESASRQRYFDYLMGAEDRKDAQFERVKETNREAFRLDLKKDTIAEDITNKGYFSQFNATLHQRGRITNTDKTGSLDVLLQRMQDEFPGVGVPSFLDSTSVNALVAAEMARYQKDARNIGDDTLRQAAVEAASGREVDLGRTLHSISNNRKQLSVYNATLKGIPGAIFDQSGAPLGYQPAAKMHDFYVAEFGEDPFTGESVEPKNRPPRPSVEEVKEATKIIDPNRKVLEDSGALDEVSETTPVSDEWLKVASDWVRESPRAAQTASVLDGSADISGRAPWSEEEVTSRDVAPSRLDMLDMLNAVDPVREDDLPPTQHTLQGRPMHSMGPDYFRAPEDLESLEPMVIPLPGDEVVDTPYGYPAPLENFGHGDTMQTLYPEELSEGLGAEGHSVTGGDISGTIQPEEEVSSQDLPPLPPGLEYDFQNFTGDTSPVIESPESLDNIESSVESGDKQALVDIQRRTNEGLMEIEKRRQDFLKKWIKELGVRENITRYGFQYPAEIAGAILMPEVAFGKRILASQTPRLYSMWNKLPWTRAFSNAARANRSAATREANRDAARATEELLRRQRSPSSNIFGD